MMLLEMRIQIQIQIQIQIRGVKVKLIQGDQSKTAPSANDASQDENDDDSSQDDDAFLDENDDRPLPSKTRPNPNWCNWKECREKI